MRQVAHLAGHHGKAAPLLARARRFHGGVERQDVGLERDGVNHAIDVGNLARRLVDLIHHRDHARHHGATLECHLRCRLGLVVGLGRTVGIAPNGLGELVHRGHCIAQRVGLLLGARRQVAVARGDFRGGGFHRPAGVAYLVQHGGNVVGKTVIGLGDLGEFVRPRCLQAVREITLSSRGDGQTQALQPRQRPADSEVQQGGRHQCNDHR